MNAMDWKKEAQTHAAEAGELKIKLKEREMDLNDRIVLLKGEISKIGDSNIIYCILNRISMHEEEIRWIKSLLNEKVGGVNG